MVFVQFSTTFAMKYENDEKRDMIVCFVQSEENADAVDNLYQERNLERRQPFRDEWDTT